MGGFKLHGVAVCTSRQQQQLEQQLLHEVEEKADAEEEERGVNACLPNPREVAWPSSGHVLP